MLLKQDVIFILDDEDFLKDENFFISLRQSLYSLRDYSFKKNVSLRIAFSKLSDDEKDENLKFYDFDSFAFSEEEKSAYFSQSGFAALNYYFSVTPPSQANIKQLKPIVIIFQNQEISHKDNFSRISCLTPFIKSKKITVNANSLQSLPDKIFGKHSFNPHFSAVGFFSSAKETIGQNKKKVCVAAALVLLALIAIPLLNFLHLDTYEKVYTGDGDRLVMRENGDLQEKEIIRLNEDETVLVLKKESVWSKIDYHGLTGYVHNEYLVPSSKAEYQITNPDSMYTFGKACIFNEINAEQGYEWIKKAAQQNLITAQWELARKAEDDGNDDEYESWLLEIDGNESCYEDKLCEKYRQTAKNLSTTSQKELMEKFIEKAADKEKNVKSIRRQTAKKLSEFYLKSDIDAASKFYAKAIEYGLTPDNEYMYNLAVGTDLNDEDSIQWLAKASGNGYVKASLFLGKYYYSKKNYDSALKYFSRVSYYNGAYAPYYCGKIYYEHKGNYYSAVSCFREAVYSNDYSYEYYLACYALGLCYEYGRGVYASNQNALSYYQKAKNRVPQAKTAYDRLYSEVYYSWY